MQPNDLAVPECGGGKSFALMVMGPGMAPDLLEGEIIIEPEGLAKGGAYVLA